MAKFLRISLFTRKIPGGIFLIKENFPQNEFSLAGKSILWISVFLLILVFAEDFVEIRKGNQSLQALISLNFSPKGLKFQRYLALFRAKFFEFPFTRKSKNGFPDKGNSSTERIFLNRKIHSMDLTIHSFGVSSHEFKPFQGLNSLILDPFRV